jgi:hypothetical protein
MYLKQIYGFINPTQLADNYNKMTAPINFQDPIETMFKQIDDDVCYAKAGMQPYMEAQYVNIAFLFILNTGATPDACKEWQCRTPVNQTVADCQREFARAQREQRIISVTEWRRLSHFKCCRGLCQNSLPADGGFVTAMANLATATSADRETVATLTKAIATLTEQLKAKDNWEKSQEAELKRFLGGHALLRPLCLLHQVQTLWGNPAKTKITTTSKRRIWLVRPNLTI